MNQSPDAVSDAAGRVSDGAQRTLAEDVYTHADLVLALDRLRRSAASGGRSRLSYARLAGRVDVPASTLHTYFTGAVVPPSDVFDRIVRALGVDTRSVARWAHALERVNDATFAGASTVGPSSTSHMRRHHDSVRTQMREPLRVAVDNSRHLLQSSLITIDAEEAIRSLETRIVVQAVAAGVDRDAIQLVSSLAADLDNIGLSRTANCALLGEQTLVDPAVRLVEVEFDHELEPGEMYSYEFTVVYSSSASELEAMHRSGPGPDVSEDGGGALKAFLAGGTYFSLDAQFDPAAVPRRVIQVHRPSYGDHTHEVVVREVPVSSWHRASMLVDRARPGVMGLRWFF